MHRKGQRKSDYHLTLHEKMRALDIIAQLPQRLPKTKMARAVSAALNRNISRTTFYDILKKADEIRKAQFEIHNINAVRLPRYNNFE